MSQVQDKPFPPQRCTNCNQTTTDFPALYRAWPKRGRKLVGTFPSPCLLTKLQGSCAEAQIHIHTSLLQRWPQFGKLSQALPHSIFNRNISLIYTMIISCVCLVFKNNAIFLISQRVRSHKPLQSLKARY